MKRFLAVGFIWGGCAVAWMLLGATLEWRTNESGSLRYGVESLWGPSGVQESPYAEADAIQPPPPPVPATLAVRDAAQPAGTQVISSCDAHLTSSDVDAELSLEYRQRGLRYFPSYTVDFRAVYEFNSEEGHDCRLRFPLAASGTRIDRFVITQNGAPVEHEVVGRNAAWEVQFAPDVPQRFEISYRSQGIERWTYSPRRNGSALRNFRMAVRTDFEEVDFPEGALSPTSHTTNDGAWEGTWEFGSLIATGDIGILLPERLNPGPLASKITFFAPVSLLFFFFVVAMMAVSRKVSLHPMHYFFLGCTFFAFHLLFAYLVDHLHVALSFGIAAVVSIGLVASYVRLFAPPSFVRGVVVPAQLIYLVLFSASFFAKGMTGLTVAVGAVITLFVVMQATGRHDWDATLSRGAGSRNGGRPGNGGAPKPKAEDVAAGASPSAF